MTIEEIRILDRPDIRELVDHNIENDPERIALDKRLPHARLIATQVKYLQRAHKKLPSFHAARCLLPPRAFEQASSEACAMHKEFSGKTCIDLTCGLGVDAYSLSKQFDRVVAVERDDILAETARINFPRLGADNIEVVCDEAEHFIGQYLLNGQTVDLLYVDPDRRSTDGRRLAAPEECSPNVLALMPHLKKIARRIVVKNSPMLDVDEALRLFGPRCTVEAVSLGGECKEVNAISDDSFDTAWLCATALGTGHFSLPANERGPKPMDTGNDYRFSLPYRYLIVPDVSLRKTRIVEPYFRQLDPDIYLDPYDGYVFAHHSPPPQTMGRVFEIVSMRPYRPKELRKEFRKRGIKTAEILKRHFPYPVARICRELGISEGGHTQLAFTETAGTLWSIEVKTISL